MELLSVKRSIVVVVDLQGKLMEMIHRPRMVIDGTVRLLRLAEMFGVPVALTEQYAKGLGPTHPEVRAAYDALTVPTGYLDKTSFGCCGDPTFEAMLERLRPDLPLRSRQVVVAGIEAHVCVMQTVQELLRAEQQVHVCFDCVSGRGEEVRHHALERMRQAGAVISNHESVGFEWARDKRHESFKAMSALFRTGPIG